jgi:hypothetical protein
MPDDDQRAAHGEELMANWERAQAMETLVTIEPLQ